MEYISGILTNLKQFPLAVGGYKNHVHIFFEQNPDTSLSDIMEKVKANSSRWINETIFYLNILSGNEGMEDSVMPEVNAMMSFIT